MITASSMTTTTSLIRFLVALDLWVRKLLAAFCVFMLAMMVVFTVYTIIMRYVFHDPPMWGDLLTSLSNIWFVFIALSLTVRDKEQIALNLIYSRLPSGVRLRPPAALDHGIILLLGLVIAVYGMGSGGQDGRQVLGDVVLRLGGRLVQCSSPTTCRRSTR